MDCLERTLHNVEISLDVILTKARFWQSIADVPINYQQARMLTLLLDDFKGKLTTAKWARIARCSQDNAQRDIDDLIGHGILAHNSEGRRGASYRLISQ